MLNTQDEARLYRIIEDINTAVAGEGNMSLTLGDVQWLALKLELLQKTVAKLRENKTDPSHRVIITQAKDLLMLKYKLPEMKAHAFLRKAAMENRTTKFQIAKKLLDSETT